MRHRDLVWDASNEYARAIVSYDRIPKAVIAAIAYSFASHIIADEDSPTMVESAILDEWRTLYQNGIVSQRPPGDAAPTPRRP